MRVKSVIQLLGVLLVVFLWVNFGRALWHPIYLKLVGGKTTAAVIHKVEGPCLSRLGLTHNDVNAIERLTLIGLKEERSLELWIHFTEGQRLLKVYPFTAFSGELGPKLREGDGQVPEGLYRIEYLNPNSSYHLSMKLNYPNEFDRARGQEDGREHLGYDIFIHGSNVTVGCIPIGDAAIEELFYLVAKIGIENVDVILAPFDMRGNQRMLEHEAIDWGQKLYSRISTELERF